jgi:hypothetical protein
MNPSPDMRIPVLFEPGQGDERDAWLVEGDRPAPAGAYTARFTLPDFPFGHAAGCACCTRRGPAAAALADMFRARAIGAAPYFRRVVVCASAAGQAAIRGALADDIVTKARFILTEAES